MLVFTLIINFICKKLYYERILSNGHIKKTLVISAHHLTLSKYQAKGLAFLIFLFFDSD